MIYYAMCTYDDIFPVDDEKLSERQFLLRRILDAVKQVRQNHGNNKNNNNIDNGYVNNSDINIDNNNDNNK